ncbi:MAG: Signal transduction response regulator / Disease resistance protein [Labilithrix sp.]|nr:Signal transduction response regulator / Disease resistance protein [Labilithrix sp.]
MPVPPVESSRPPSRASRRPALIGREHDIDTLTALLARRAHVTIVGAAGVGKTRLAREVAAANERLVFFCDLTEARSADDVVRSVAGTLSVEPGEGDPVERVASVLAAKAGTCLVLDGVDRLAPATWDETVTLFLDACPELHVLATARARLRVEGEAVFPLSPLALPGDDGTISPAEQLFLRLAEDVLGRDLRENGRVPDDVRALVIALDGVPLALEIAASALNVLTPSEFLARRSVLLDAPPRDESWSGGSLRAALEVSWQRLSPEQRDALGSIAVFAGDFDLAAAEAVVGPNALGILSRLCDASFVASSTVGGRTRFRMFESVRQFVGDRLPDVAAQHGARARHAAYFGAGALAWTHRGETGERLLAIDWLLAEERNVTAVAQRVLDEGAERIDGDLELAAAALSGLAWLWLGRGPLEPHTRLLLEIEDLVRRPSLAHSVAVTTFFLMLGSVRRHLGDNEAATRAIDDALARAPHLELPHLEARCWLERARLAQLRGERDMARSAVDAALAIGEATGNDTVRVLAILSSRLAGRPLDEAQLDTASLLAEKTGDPLVIARTALASGTFFFLSGRPAEALEHLRRVELASDQLGQRTWRALAGIVAGNALAELGRADEARAKLEETIESGRFTAHRRSEGEARGNLAMLDLEAGRMAEAASGLSRALELFVREDPARLFFGAALAAVEAWQSDRAPAAVARFVAARDRALDLAPSLGLEIERFGQMLHLLSATAPAPISGRQGAPDGAARVARRVRENVQARLQRDALIVGRDAAWFRAPQNAVVSLVARPVLRALLRELCAARQASAGGTIPREQLVAAIWPDERSSARSMGNRLSVAISTLRGLGVKAISTTGQGVGLDPEVAVIHVEDAEPPA